MGKFNSLDPQDVGLVTSGSPAHTSIMVESTPIDACTLTLPMTDEVEAIWVVNALRAAADPTRLHILQLLTEAGKTCVCNLPARVNIPQNLLSHHLKVLREAGLIHGTKRGRWVDYTADEAALARLQAAIPQVRVNARKGA